MSYTQAELNKAFSVKVRNYDDCLRIVEVANSMGLAMTLEQAELVWKDYSEASCAGWLCVSTSGVEIRNAIESFIEKRLQHFRRE